MGLPVVALLGRPNVGKSALFNRLAGEDSAIVSEEAGTTRDRHFTRAEWQGRAFWLVDTGGITDDPHKPMDVQIRKQVEQAIEEADLLLFVVDAIAGLHPIDERVGALLRSSGKPMVLVANKADNPKATDFYEFYALGVGEPVPVSAQSGKQTGDLLDVIVAEMPEEIPEDTAALRVAVIGRPNVGKSSFVNRLVGEERVVVAADAGTTRDAIDTPMRFHSRDLILVDTAGLRRQSRVSDGIEFYATLRTRRAIDRADICCLMIDAATGIEGQDMKIANLAWENGRGLVIIVNKWDLVDKDDKSSAKFEKTNRDKAPFLKHVPFLFTSALTGQRVTKILEVLMEVDAERQKRITTARVNETLGELIQRRQPPQAAGREIKLLYATQVEVAPPTFAIFSNYPDLLEQHYVRYLHNGFRDAWQFTGNPVRILLRRRAA